MRQIPCGISRKTYAISKNIKMWESCSMKVNSWIKQTGSFLSRSIAWRAKEYCERVGSQSQQMDGIVLHWDDDFRFAHANLNQCSWEQRSVKLSGTEQRNLLLPPSLANIIPVWILTSAPLASRTISTLPRPLSVNPRARFISSALRREYSMVDSPALGLTGRYTSVAA